MKIALVALHYAEYSYALGLALSARHDVLLVLDHANAVAELSELPPSSAALTVRSLTHRPRPDAVLRTSRQLSNMVTEYDPDVVHIQEVSRDSLAAALPFWHRLPIVVTVHDPQPHSGEQLRLLQRRHQWYETLQRQSSRALITHGEHLADQLGTLTGRPASQIYNIPHGTLGSLPGDGQPPAYDSTGSVTLVGRMHHYKGVDVLSEALKVMASAGRPARAVIAGRGPALNACLTTLESLPGVTVVDRFLSRRDLLDAVDSASVVVLPYRDGTQTGVGLLAIGRGRPIVATDVGSIPEVCRHGLNGLLVPPSDASALAATLAQVTSDVQLAQRLAAGSSYLAQAEFCWIRIASMTEDVYRLVVR